MVVTIAARRDCFFAREGEGGGTRGDFSLNERIRLLLPSDRTRRGASLRERRSERRKANVNSLMHLFIPLLEYFQSHLEPPSAFRCSTRDIHVCVRAYVHIYIYLYVYIHVSKGHSLVHGCRDVEIIHRLFLRPFPLSV